MMYRDVPCLPILRMAPETDACEFCISWDMQDGTRNTSLYSLAELERALEWGTFTGCANIRIEIKPFDREPLFCEEERA